MTRRSILPGQFAKRFARASRLRADLQRKERATGTNVQELAKGLADLLEAGTYLHRRGVGIHAFDVDGAICLAAAYLDSDGDEYRYRYAVLCGGQAAKRALRTTALDASDSDDPGAGRRVALATYADYDDFIDRLPAYIGDITRSLGARIQHTEAADAQIGEARQQVSALAKQSARARH